MLPLSALDSRLWKVRCSGQKSSGFRHREPASGSSTSLLLQSAWDSGARVFCGLHTPLLGNLPFSLPCGQTSLWVMTLCPLALAEEGQRDPAWDTTTPHQSGNDTRGPNRPICGHRWVWKRGARGRSFPFHRVDEQCGYSFLAMLNKTMSKKWEN